MKTYNHFINGLYSVPSGGQYFDTENPYTGKVWAKVARGNAGAFLTLLVMNLWELLE